MTDSHPSTPKLTILPWSPEHAAAFYEISAEWISSMYSLEEADLQILRDPQGQILDRGGDILFVHAEDLGIVGTCALMPMPGGAVELTKMGVLKSARGRGAGAFLLEAILRRAEELNVTTLFLLSNKKSAAAIALYEKMGFVHDASLLTTFGARYQRCDVAMVYRGTPSRGE